MKKKLNITIEQVDALLPQTQCGLCSYPACRPYAEAIINGERIDRCPPGGVKTLLSLAQLTGQEAPSNMILNMEKNVRPERVAIIREEECIGCTKCLQACPVDAIIGAAKLMHTVINDACTGCELCITPCPVDCIDMVEIAKRDDEQQSIFANQSRYRYQRHIKKEQIEKLNEQPKTPNIAMRQAEIAAAMARVKARNQKHESTNTS